ncbi:hypothetical protein JCM33374_g3367 [Metschnikowia sp. JCM 33374]|nr:hypothetical protein JCM33374_g3367 [Metschnikowia sp. JCM 33374]
MKHYKSVASKLRESLNQASKLLKTLEDDKFVAVSEGDESHENSPGCMNESPRVKPETTLDAHTREATLDAYTQLRHAPTQDAPRKYFPPKTFQNAKHVSVSVYGPTSIFDNESLPHRELLEEHKPASLSKNPKIIECIKLFFRWQYPDMHAFIFREAFLLDFFDPDSLAVYSSTELVYAVCSVGASMSQNPQVRESAEQFYRMSRDLVMATMDSPSISSLQAYLLLGLYDIYNHRNNSGWMLTGGALRMGLGIGFHLRPESWLIGDNKNISEITISVRSRIFWGCFMADRFVSLILGRPSVIKPDESTIHVSANMPAIQWIEPYTYPGLDPDGKIAYIDISNPISSIIKLAKISDNMMENVFSWREELPVHLRWDRALLEARGHDTTKMFLRYYFYILLMCLNRPFVEVSKGQQSSSFNSLVICMDALSDVHAAIYSFVKAHGPLRCSILIVYSCLIGASILLTKTRGFSPGTTETDLFFDFMTVLRHTSITWKLSEKSFLKICATLKSEHDIDYEAEVQRHKHQERGHRSIIDLLENPSDKVDFLYPDLDMDGGGVNVSDFGVFGDASSWTSLFPDFFSADSF